MSQEKKNFAFISYNHNDVKWAKWLQKNLESYKLPSEIHNEFEDSKFIRPVFRDQTDLNTGILANTLRDNLEASQFLLVLCSPNSAKSEWVSKEVQSFIEWGRLDQIIPIIVDGQPNCYNPDLECFPRYLREYTKEHPEAELLGVSIAEVGKKKAFIRVVSRMLGVSFDVLWKRHERQRRQRIITRCISGIVAALLLYWFALPVSVQVTLSQPEHHLPIATSYDGVAGTLEFDGETYQLMSLDTTLSLHSLTGYHRLSSQPIRFVATYYDTLTTELKVGAGLSSSINLQLKRDDTFAVFSGKVVDEDSFMPVAGAQLVLTRSDVDETYRAVTDETGAFSVTFPLIDQREDYDLTITADGYRTFESEAETLGTGVIYRLGFGK